MGFSVCIFSSDDIRGKILYRTFFLEGADVTLTGIKGEISSVCETEKPDVIVFDTNKRFDLFSKHINLFETLKWKPEIVILLENKNLCLIKRRHVNKFSFFTEPFDPESIISVVRKKLQRRNSKKKSFIPAFPFSIEQPFSQNLPLVF